MTSAKAEISERWGRREQGILKELKSHLESVSEIRLNAAQLNEAATLIAGQCLTLSKHLETRAERKQSQQLSQLMNDELGQLFSTLLTDRVPRLADGNDVTQQAKRVLSTTGIPQSMPLLDQCQLMGLKLFGGLAPKTIGKAVRKRIQQEAQTFLIRGEAESLGPEVRALKNEGVKVNVNQLGEEVLGAAEARHHMESYLALLATPGIDTISVKVSSICAQLSVLAFDASLARVCDALRVLYRAAKSGVAGEQKLVMLDMEAYRDLELTYAAFTKVLDEPEFQDLTAGIVLQAYLPDSHSVHEDLLDWAATRHRNGGAPVQMRLVKGANLAVERIESALAGWALPIFPSKTHVDASFKIMVERALDANRLEHVRVGIASHNLFDVAYALCLIAQRHLQYGVHFEVLSGMAGGLSRVLLGLGCDVLVYSPAVADANLHAAVAYLVRRLDENTADQNFLRHSFDMNVGDAAWHDQKAGFEASRSLSTRLDLSRRRRDQTQPRPSRPAYFVNEPDTDFTLRENRQWLDAHLTRQAEKKEEVVTSRINGEHCGMETLNGFDPSRPGTVPYTIKLATPEDVEAALSVASKTQSTWSHTKVDERVKLVLDIAEAIRERRGILIAALLMDGGKAVVDADAEISEAIDFCTYYADRMRRLSERNDIHLKPRGVTVVTPPWNFPFAIPLGGVVAGLVTGNCVILKPALETPYIAQMLASICYDAGVAREVLQFVVANDEIATPLIQDERVATVVLTGGTQTADLFRSFRPALHLLAETGGKNATIVSHFADRDLAVNSIIQSAFGHAGQKCSATSLLIITKTLAADPLFAEQLVDAASSMHVASAWDLNARVTPLVAPPQGALKTALTKLDEGEVWWLEPRVHPDNPRLWSPGIKANVQPMSLSHVTEFFGPVLSVMVAEDVTQAIEWANATPYGLTAGFHSLDEDEQRLFLSQMNAGNLYINRTTTGAIVQRQPFGGRKASCFGPGSKAGGPNYLNMFVHLETLDGAQSDSVGLTPSLQSTVDSWRGQGLNLRSTAQHYVVAFKSLSAIYDPTNIAGQDNLFRYQFTLPVLVLVFEGAKPDEVARVQLALQVCGAPHQILALGGEHIALNRILGASNDRDWVDMIESGDFGHIRALGNVPSHVYEVASKHARCVDTTTVSLGSWELKKYALEQSICIDYHRYGHLGLREHEGTSVIGEVARSVPS